MWGDNTNGLSSTGLLRPTGSSSAIRRNYYYYYLRVVDISEAEGWKGSDEFFKSCLPDRIQIRQRKSAQFTGSQGNRTLNDQTLYRQRKL